jgi:hypothetical protein
MTGTSASSKSRSMWAQFAGILLAAIVLGLIYNDASPLHVRKISADDSLSIPAVAIPPKPATVRTGVDNESFSPTLEQPTLVKAAVPVAAAPQLVIPSLKWPEVKALLHANRVVLVDARAK